jgi:hypothetical protein
MLHHSLKYTSRNLEFSVNVIPSDEEDENKNPDTQEARDPLVRAALALFPSVPSRKYRTYHIAGTENHTCTKCTHFHQKFPPGMGTGECSDDELLDTH